MIRRFMMRSGGVAQYIAGASYSPALSSTQAIPLSAYQAGDVVLIFVTDSSSGNPQLSGWTRDSFIWNIYGYPEVIFWKRLVSGDLSGVTVTGLGTGSATTIDVVGYRGAAVAVQHSVAQSTEPATTLVLPGFTKSPGSKRLVSRAVDRDPSSSVSMTRPTGWTNRLSPHLGGGNNFASSVADFSAAAYVSGNSSTWTGFVGTFHQVGYIYELM